MLPHVGIDCKWVLDCCLVEDHALAGAQDVVQERLRQHGLGRGTVPQAHDDRVATGCGLRHYAILITSRKDQYSSLSTRVLNCGAHERVDELLQDDLPRYGL